MRRRAILCVALAVCAFAGLDVAVDAEAEAEEFEYMPPGELESGDAGYTGETVYVSGMRFPMESAPAYPNSQVWNPGGMHGGGGGQCHSSNYSYPWYDNFCEPRQWTVPSCPGGTGHQGQDIRPATCDDSTHRVVASEDGQITNIGTYSVFLDNTPSGTRHRYLHLDMSQLYVSQGQWVEKGDPLGYASNDFGGTPTTIHLHYDIYQGNQYVSPYMSLVESYKELPGIDAHQAEYAVALEVRTTGLDDFYSDGSSRGVSDALENEEFRAEILLTNESNEVIRDVELGVLLEAPFVEPVSYSIESDHPEHDRSSWTTNSADPTETSDNPNSLANTTHLKMHAFTPGETKRVAIDLRANQYSIGQTDHVDIRGWLTHATGADNDQVFAGHSGGWGDEASTSEVGSRIAERTHIDILSTDEWLFESGQHRADLEGWDVCFPGHHSDLVHNEDNGALALEVDGDRGCVASPSWTSVDADTFDEMVVEMRSHDGPRDAALYWAGESDLPPLEVPCDEVARVSGEDRFASAAAVSEHAFENGADEVVLVTGVRPTTDAVVGGALAASRDAPLLLTQSEELPGPIEDEISRLNPQRATLIGGEFAIDPAVENQLESMGMEVERHWGQQRFETAHAVAVETGAPTQTAVIATGDEESLIDGVYAAGLAAHLDAPVLLVGQEVIPPSTTEALDELDIQETIVIGGTAAVSEEVEQALPSPLRLGGASRHETALAVGGFALETGLDTDHAYISRDDNVIDAFSASAVGDVLLVSPPDGLTTGIKTALGDFTDSATLVGGEAALTEEVERDACDAYRLRHALDESRAIRFEHAGDGEFHQKVISLGGDYEEWNGAIHFLRMMPLYGERPQEDDSGWYDIGEVFFQDSSTEETSSAVRDYVDGPYVETELLDDPYDPGGPADPDDPTGPDDVMAPSFFGEDGEVQTNESCSSTGAGGTAPMVLLALVALMVVRHRRAAATAVASAALALAVVPQAHADFEYMPPGQLESGDSGYTAATVYLSGMRFPMESAPAYPNSQVWNEGGMHGGGGGQCHSSNYSYPWYDNFCEPRQWSVPLCPGGTGHQGQDIRPATCADSTHRVVASEDGQITSIGTYAVRLDNTPSGTRHRYLHMDMSQLYVSQGQWVEKGDPLGYVSDDFGGTPTTIHLHYDIYQGGQYVSPYMSLVESYKDLIGEAEQPAEPGGCVPTADDDAQGSLFADFPDDSLGADEAALLYDHGITQGCGSSDSELMFCPRCPTTRQGFVAMLVRAAGIDVSNPPSNPTFDDVEPGSTFYNYVEAAYEAGITDGCGGGQFCGNEKISRGAAAAMLHRALGWPDEVASSAPSFSDVGEDHTFYEEIETLKQRCVTEGYEGGEFRPGNEVPRRTAAIFIARAFNLDDINPCAQPGGCSPRAAFDNDDAYFADFRPDEHGYDEAVALAEAGITNGCSDSPPMFCQDCTASRGAMVALVARAAGLDTSNLPSTPTFDDVAVDSTFYPYVEAAYEAGITDGCGDDRFCPSRPITRQGAAAMLRRAAGWTPEEPSTPTFDDVPTDHRFYGDIEAIKDHCVTEGCGGGDRFCPGREMSRGAAAIFVARTFDVDGLNPCDSADLPDLGDDPSDNSDSESTGSGVLSDSGANMTAKSSGCAAAGTGGAMPVFIAVVLIGLFAARSRS